MKTVKPASPDRPHDGDTRGALPIALALTGLTILPAILHPWIRTRADSWFHAAIVAEIERAGVPPQDPYFAGLPLQYMWFFHAMLAAVRKVAPVDTFTLMVLVNALALMALILVSAHLAEWIARRTGDEPARAARTAAYVVPLGLGVLVWLVMPIRALKALAGKSGGMEQLAEAFRWRPLDIGTIRTFLSDFGSVPFFLNKFLVGTAYGLALVAFLVYLAAVLSFIERPRLKPLLVVMPALFLALMFHPVVGFTTVAVSGITGVVLLVLGPRRGGQSFGAVAAWGGSVVVSLLLAVPYLVGVTRGKPGGQLVPIHFDWVNVAGLLVGVLFVAIAAAGLARRLWREGTPWGRMLVTWIIATLVFASFIRLPGPNTTDKFTYLLYLPPAILAGVALSSRWRGMAGLLAALAILAPANLLAWASYLGEPDYSRRPVEVVEAYDWLRANTPRDAIVLDSRERCDVLVSVPRRQFWGREAYAEQWGYDEGEMARRRYLRDQLVGPSGIAARNGPAIDTGPLAATGAPVFVIVRAEDVGAAAFEAWGEAHPQFSEAHRSAGIRLFQLLRLE
ncbi:MAG TPA: hypothetical protein VF720_12130 [Candidatus Eisenbacteria bacterium]